MTEFNSEEDQFSYEEYLDEILSSNFSSNPSDEGLNFAVEYDSRDPNNESEADANYYITDEIENGNQSSQPDELNVVEEIETEKNHSNFEVAEETLSYGSSPQGKNEMHTENLNDGHTRKNTYYSIFSSKRQRKEENWIRNKTKRLRQEGKAYINTAQKPIRAKHVQPIGEGCTTCRFKCSMIQEEDRWEIFESFYSLDAQGKRMFLSNFTERDLPKKRRTGKNATNSKKQFIFKYYFNIREQRVRVCKHFFLLTLDISQKSIYNVHAQKNDVSGVPRIMKQGRHVKTKIAEPIKEAIRKHISGFPTVESHYCRRDSTKTYLEPSLNITKMWRLFIEEANNEEEKNVKSHLYRQIFENEFNISFFKPKKDRCDLCEQYKVTSNNFSNISQELNAKYEEHQLQKIKSRENRELDRRSSIPVICFDLQNVLSCPKAEVSSFFYHSKLNTYNLTAHLSTNNKVYCALWSENLMGRSGNDLASALIKILEKVITDNTHFEEMILWSDSCVPQNRNSILSFALINFIKDHPQISKITLRFSTPGHSCIQEIDAVHSVIERNLKKIEYYSPISLFRILLKILYKRQNLILLQMKAQDFKNYQSGSKIFNFKTIPFTKVCEIEFSKNIFTVGFKTNLYKEDFDFINLKYDKPLRKAAKNTSLFEYPKIEIEKKRNKISEAKIKSFKAMLPFMPKVDFDYFANLIKTNSEL